MSLLVEIHVPLIEPEDPPDGPAFPWIDVVDEFLWELEESGELEVYDDGEQDGDVYVFFVAGAGEDALLAAASRVVALDGVPAGAVAFVTDDRAEEFGLGRRVELPVP
ncbi:hypothetical protein [Cryptosporangium aurantiacum]|uniref:Uncharacterized protein n=1 Tax=Cryptosporangium aurantiacum TaxID=134849 RepID=A0A1M7RPI9_9ACTN|nr:hypothetical protein [Cryptosporangium aurantiacum]SHN48071.1 hypothetical protein SAMN05443668_13318 [Cryptosporangium aurantiacum]